MKIALVCFSLNAQSCGTWNNYLDSVKEQTLQPDILLLVDSESNDNSVGVAQEYGWEIYHEKRAEFNHGKTRNKIIYHLAERGFDVAIFTTQDITLVAPDSLEKLVNFLTNNSVVATYGRQISQDNPCSYDYWQRNKCYGDYSYIKDSATIQELGLMTPFCSNAFSAWKISEMLSYGGFPQAEFGEDMLIAGHIIISGGAVGYCAEACCFHTHSDDWKSLFNRGLQVGVLHRKSPWLLAEFGSVKLGSSTKPKSLNILTALGVKFLGYLCGNLSTTWLFFILLTLLMLPLILLNDIPYSDVASRYAPMAEAFSQGDWRFAFHPRIQPIFPVMSGVIAFIFQIDGFLACKLAGAFMLIIGVFPLWHGVKNLYGERQAKLALVLYLFCPYLMRLGYAGLRESTSCFAILLAYYAMSLLFKNKRSLLGVFYISLSSSILLLNRGDTVIAVGCFFLVLLIWDVLVHKLPWRTFGAGVLVLLLISPWLYYNYRQIGYGVPDVRHAAAIRSLEQRLNFKFPTNPTPNMPLDIEMTGGEE